MPIKSRTYLKTKFESGDKPTQADFFDFIDSFVHETEDSEKFLSDNEKILLNNIDNSIIDGGVY